MDKLKYVKLEQPDGSYSESIPLAVDAEYIDVNGETLMAILKSQSTNLNLEVANRQNNDNTLQTQINSIVASAGTAGSSSSEIVQARVNSLNSQFSTINDRINFVEKILPFNTKNAVSDVDFDTFITPGKWVVTSVSTHNPKLNDVNYGDSGILIVETLRPNNQTNPTNFQYVVQRWYPLELQGRRGFAERYLVRATENPLSYTAKSWNIYDYPYISKLYDNSIVSNLDRGNLVSNFASNRTINDDTDFNTLLDEGNYIVASGTGTNNPISNSGLLTVDSFFKTGNTYKWVRQTFCDIRLNELYERMIQYDTTGGKSTYAEWKKIYPIEIPPIPTNNILLSGKKIVNFGDSIFGNYRGEGSVSEAIADVTDATVYNVGFGGCMMVNRNDYSTKWGAFSMCKLADAIANNDFSMQDTAIANTSWSDRPAYFAEQLALLKSIDFSEVDYISIAYGTNDYAMGKNLDDINNNKNINTFAGALRYSIETLLAAYPNLRILIGSPIYRLWLSQGQISDTSDTRTFAGNYTLIDMKNKVIAIGQEYHIPVLNAYDELGLNRYNWSAFFSSSDTVHPNENGRKKLGRLYGMRLLNL